MIVVIGANPTDGHPVFASRLKRRVREGAKLIVVDPRRIDIVANAAREGVASPGVAARHERRHDQRARAHDRDRRAGEGRFTSRALRHAMRSSNGATSSPSKRIAPNNGSLTGVPAESVREAARFMRTPATVRSTTAWA